MRRFSEVELKRLRNELPIREVIERLLQLPAKEVEGVYRFLCPLCGEFQTGLNPKSNLARCFRCQRNFNPIELVMAERGLNFVESVKLLRDKEQLRCEAHQHLQSESEEDVLKLVRKLAERSCLQGRACAGD